MISLREFIAQKINDYTLLRDATIGRCRQQYYAGKIEAYVEILREINDVQG